MIKPLHNSVTRCLAHDEDGKPNGCARADSCHRHLALRGPAIVGTGFLLERACTDDLMIHFIPVPAKDEA